MARDTRKHSPPSPEALFSATQAPVPSSPRFWVRLLSSRPLTVLGSLWLITICAGAVAIQRLVFNTPDHSTAETPSQVQASPSAPGTPTGELPLGETETDSVTEIHRRKTNVTLWGVSSLAVCVLGSWVITQQTKASGRRRPSRQPKRRGRRRGLAKTKAPSGPRRLQPYSPDRDAIIVQGARAVVDTLPLTLAETEGALEADDLALNLFDDAPEPGVQDHPAPGVSATAPTAPPSPAQPQAMKGHPPEPHSTEVLPDGEAHPLDWEEESLAHSLDLRQRRSLSSLL